MVDRARSRDEQKPSFTQLGGTEETVVTRSENDSEYLLFVVCIMLFIEIHPIVFFIFLLVLSNLRGCESTLLLTTFGFGCSIHCIVTTTFFVQTAWIHIKFVFLSSNYMFCYSMSWHFAVPGICWLILGEQKPFGESFFSV